MDYGILILSLYQLFDPLKENMDFKITPLDNRPETFGISSKSNLDSKVSTKKMICNAIIAMGIGSKSLQNINDYLVRMKKRGFWEGDTLSRDTVNAYSEKKT